MDDSDDYLVNALLAEHALAEDECEVCELFGRLGRELCVDEHGMVICSSCADGRRPARRRSR